MSRLMGSPGVECDMVTLVAVLWMLSAGGRAEGESPVRLAPVQVRAGGYLNRALVAELEEAQAGIIEELLVRNPGYR